MQLVPSELNELWPLALNLRSYARLGGPKELVTLAGKPHWEFTVEFEEAFCAIVMRWFQQHGASLAPAHEDA